MNKKDKRENNLKRFTTKLEKSVFLTKFIKKRDSTYNGIKHKKPYIIGYKLPANDDDDVYSKKLKFNEGSNCVAPLTPTSIRFITLQSPLSHPLGVGVTCISNTPVPCCFCFARLDLRRVLTSYSTVSFSS